MTADYAPKNGDQVRLGNGRVLWEVGIVTDEVIQLIRADHCPDQAGRAVVKYIPRAQSHRLRLTYRGWYERAEKIVEQCGIADVDLAWAEADMASGERDAEGWGGEMRPLSEDWCERFLRLFTEALADEHGIDPADLGLKAFH